MSADLVTKESRHSYWFIRADPLIESYVKLSIVFVSTLMYVKGT